MMRAALALARRSLGRTWPNPAVGCVIVKDGQVIARGRTREGGRPHAEADAIAQASGSGTSGSLAGATVYVTLEPCAHHGRTPPCADALVAAGVARVVSALEDPDPRVKGQGHARLKGAGIAVEVGEGAMEAAEINAGFLLRLGEGRPLFDLKLASSLDGRIATAAGESKWTTGEGARADGQRLRATHDAILIGLGTARADDPELTCRLPGLAARSPLRIVLDSRARLAPTSRLAATARQVPVWVICTSAAPAEARERLQAAGVEIIEVSATAEGRVDVAAVASTLGGRGLTRVLIEGGGEIASAFLKAGLVDRVSSYRAGLVIGADGRSAVAAIGTNRLDFAPRFKLVSARSLLGDTLESWTRAT
ncbi:bifunctional diaminohydroxyphosphoribosylaminopyrimidine deaminase/5-amino-6-(5-phosphoribosylamino)uracil reductase RibD [soil metagenome]